MDVIVSGRNIEISEMLRETVTEKISRLSKYLDGMEYAEVHFFEEKNPRINDKEVCEVTMEGHGHHVRAKVRAPDPFIAVDLVVDKLEHQLHKLKTKIVDRKHGGKRSSAPAMPNGDALLVSVGADADETERAGERRIVKTKRFTMKPMTAEEATLQMELLGHSFFFFTNSETQRCAVVYERGDGDVGLIDEVD